MRRNMIFILMLIVVMVFSACESTDFFNLKKPEPVQVNGKADLDQVLVEIDSQLEKEPNDLNAVILKAHVLHKKGEVDAAVDVLNEAIKADEKLEFLVELGDLLIKIGKTEKGLEQYKRAVFLYDDKITEEQGSEIIYLTKAYIGVGSNDEAERWVNFLIEEGTYKNEGYILLGRICLTEERIYEAIAYFKTALESDQENDEILALIGLAYAQDYEDSLALEYLTRALIINPDHVLALKERSKLYYDFGDLERQDKDLQRFRRLAPYDQEMLLEMIEGYEIESNYRGMIDIYKELLKQDPENSEYYSALSDAYYYGDFYEESVSEMLKMKDHLNLEDFYINMAYHYYLIDYNDEAIAMYEEAIKAFPENLAFVEGLADVYEYIEDYDQVKKVFEAYGERTTVLDMLELRAPYYYYNDLYDEAFMDYKQLITINPENSMVYSNNILDYMIYIESEQAVEWIKIFYEAFPDNVYVAVLEGVYLNNEGEYEASIHSLMSQLDKFIEDPSWIYFRISEVYSYNSEIEKSAEALKKAIAANPEIMDRIEEHQSLQDVYSEWIEE